MSKRVIGICVAAVFGALSLSAQSAPTSYTVTQVNGMFGEPVTMTIYRDGSKVVIDHLSGGGATTHSRALEDLNAHTSISWSVDDSSGGCGSATFSGDWGDPFASSGDIMGELAKENAKQSGTETVNGFATKVYETDGTGPNKIRAKVWIDQKYGFVVKMQMAQGADPLKTMLEIKNATFTAPPAAIFKVPASCAAAAAAGPAPTDNQRYAEETGGKPDDFVNAIMGPGSKEACSVSFRIVQAGSLTPITSGVEVLLDRKVDLDHPSTCKDTIGKNNYHTYTGCSLQDVTPQYKNGVAKFDAVPESMNLSVIFLADGSETSALIYRQCASPNTPLYLVLKNPQKVTDGADWMFVKSGKLAGK